MGGYRGDGYGAYGDHGDDQGRDMREGRGEGGRGRDFMLGERERGGEGEDERAIRAAEAYRSRYGVQGHEGQYGGGAVMDMDRHGGNERWDSDSERRHNFSGVGRFGTGQAESGPRGGGLHDDHYRSWRDRHIAELDRDYQDFCREREQEFGSSFQSWRQQRRSGGSADPSGVRPGETVSSAPGSESEVQADQASDSLVSNEESGGRKRR